MISHNQKKENKGFVRILKTVIFSLLMLGMAHSASAITLSPSDNVKFINGNWYAITGSAVTFVCDSVCQQNTYGDYQIPFFPSRPHILFLFRQIPQVKAIKLV